MTTIIVVIAIIAFIGGFIYLKASEKNTAETIANIIEEAKDIQEVAQAEVEKEVKKAKAPRKKKETTNEGPIRTKSSKKAVK